MSSAGQITFGTAFYPAMVSSSASWSFYPPGTSATMFSCGNRWGGIISALNTGGKVFLDILRGVLTTPLFEPTPPQHRQREDDRYLLDRGLKLSSGYTYALLGRSIDVWVKERVLAAHRAGKNTVKICVLGPGDGNTERELAVKIAPDIKALGVKLEIVTLNLPYDRLTSENLAAIRVLEGAGIFLDERYGDFDSDIAVTGADVVYGIHSTVHSKDELALTERIHNIMAEPTRDYSGGEAFFMYRARNFSDAIGERHFNLERRNLDMTVVRTPDMVWSLASMRRIRPEPLTDFENVLNAVMEETALCGYRERAGGERMFGSTEAFELFVVGARALFEVNGIDPESIPEGMHRENFNLVLPGITRGQPVIPDAVGSLYAVPCVLEAIREWGPSFRYHLPRPRSRSQVEAVLFDLVMEQHIVDI